MEKILSGERSKTDINFRNTTILSIVKPLIGFVKRLPSFALTTENKVTERAKAVRKALLDAKEPDELLFKALPQACDLPDILGDENDYKKSVKTFRKRLVQALSSLQAAYDDLLGQCENLIKRAFAIKIDSPEFRDSLRYKAMNLSSQVIEKRLKSFILAATDKKSDNRSWLESILLIISNKPPKTWTDKDVMIFEIKLSDIARRFMNLEALQKEMAIPSEGIDARRITVTYPDGDEIHQVLWIDREKQTKIERIADEIIDNYCLNDDMNLKQAVTAALIEKIFHKLDEKTEIKEQELKKELKVV